MAIGTTPGDVLACAILDPNAPGVGPGSVGVVSVVPDSPTSVLVTLSAPVDASGVAVLAAMDGDPANVRAVSVEPTGSPSVWRVSWASAGGGGVTAVTASAPVTSSGGAAPVIGLAPGVANGDVLTWNGAAWAGTAPAAGITGTIAANEVAFGTGVDSIGGSAQLEWNPGTGILTVSDPAVTPVLTVDTTSAVVDLAVNELRLAGNAGAAGEVLTSQGTGAAPVWAAAAAASPRTYPINVSHNNASVLWGPSVWLDFGFDPVTSAARFYLPTLGDEGRLILSSDRVTTVAEFVTPVAGAPGLYDATFSSGVSVLAPGWYVFGVRKTAGPGTVECLGLYLT